ncbi:hypothetical protein AB595_09935 [Massilia sp. WF1]|nr:hypothetical protein AM586_28030 [Massilia sp. WG5]KLU36951.1 hypothetical protein AB595_09935 [Massilia sp. WF1]
MVALEQTNVLQYVGYVAVSRIGLLTERSAWVKSALIFGIPIIVHFSFVRIELHLPFPRA